MSSQDNMNTNNDKSTSTSSSSYTSTLCSYWNSPWIRYSTYALSGLLAGVGGYYGYRRYQGTTNVSSR